MKDYEPIVAAAVSVLKDEMEKHVWEHGDRDDVVAGGKSSR